MGFPLKRGIEGDFKLGRHLGFPLSLFAKEGHSYPKLTLSLSVGEFPTIAAEPAPREMDLEELDVNGTATRDWILEAGMVVAPTCSTPEANRSASGSKTSPSSKTTVRNPSLLGGWSTYRKLRRFTCRDSLSFEQLLGDAGEVDLVGSVVDAGGAFLAVEEAEDGVVRDTEGTVDLDGAINNALEGLRDLHLDEGNFEAGGLCPVLHDAPCGMKGGEAGGVQFNCRYSEVLLHQLLVG